MRQLSPSLFHGRHFGRSSTPTTTLSLTGAAVPGAKSSVAEVRGYQGNIETLNFANCGSTPTPTPTPNAPPKVANFVSQDVPFALDAGQTYTVTGAAAPTSLRPPPAGHMSGRQPGVQSVGKAEGRAGLGGRAPCPVSVTVLTLATDGREDSPTARLPRILAKMLARHNRASFRKRERS